MGEKDEIERWKKKEKRKPEERKGKKSEKERIDINTMNRRRGSKRMKCKKINKKRKKEINKK